MTTTRRTRATRATDAPGAEDATTRLLRLAEEAGAKILGVRLPGAATGKRAGVHIITIPNWRPPTLNSTMRGTIRTRIRHGKSCRQVIATAALHAAKIPQATGARRVTLEITFPNRRHLPDPDALFKSLGDALEHAGMIVDDSYACCEWAPPVYFLGDKLETRIILEDIPRKIIEREPEK